MALFLIDLTQLCRMLLSLLFCQVNGVTENITSGPGLLFRPSQ